MIPFRVLVCGGRDYCDLVAVYKALDVLHASRGPITELISGAAHGADTHGLEWAKDRKIPFVAMPADWNQHGRAAGPIRNREMLKTNPDYVVAFPGGRGTADMVQISLAAGVPVWEPYAT